MTEIDKLKQRIELHKDSIEYLKKENKTMNKIIITAHRYAISWLEHRIYKIVKNN
jgi:hypothetical protein